MADLETRVHPDDHGLLYCQHCEEMVAGVLSESGPHIRADCDQCGRYIRFVKQNLPPEERAYWDARKGNR